MQGDAQVIEFLNEQLTAELTAINQYFLHSKIQENAGWPKLARHTRAQSIDEMRHAETLTDRILFLDGLPNYQRLSPLRIGQTVREMFESDLRIEMDAVDRLRRGIDYMRSVADVTSARIFGSRDRTAYGNTNSSGSTSSRQNSSTQSSFFWNSGSVEKSQLMQMTPVFRR